MLYAFPPSFPRSATILRSATMSHRWQRNSRGGTYTDMLRNELKHRCYSTKLNYDNLGQEEVEYTQAAQAEQENCGERGLEV